MQTSMDDYHDRAHAKEAAGDLQGAERVYQEMIRKNPLEPSAYNNLGRLRGMQGNYEGAAQAFQRAIEHDPYNLSAQFNMARLCNFMKDYVAAEWHFRNSVYLDPEDEEIRSDFYTMLRPERDQFFELSMDLERGTDLSGADQIYGPATDAIPDDPACLFMLGLVFFVGEDYPTSKQIFADAISLDKNFGLAWMFLANSYSAMGQTDKGSEIADFVANTFMLPHFRRKK
jgi:Tfp pilus assembly protein PilF